MQDPKNKSEEQPSVCLYRKKFMGMGIKLMQADLTKHLYYMHFWANHEYAIQYWQKEGDIKQFFDFYATKLKTNEEIILIAYLDELPIAQIEIFTVLNSALKDHIKAGTSDLGMHFIMAPYRDMLKKVGDKTMELSIAVLQSVLEYLFYNARAKNIIVEIDNENKNACLLAKHAGFDLLKKIVVPEKAVALFRYKMPEFLKKFPRPPKDTGLNLFADKFQ